jgi:hypothetical protein
MKPLIYTLLFFTLIIIGSACVPTGGDISSNTDSLNFTISKGAHYCSPRLIQTHPGISKITYYIQFEDNCKYKLNTIDSNDINKAYGFSYGMHQNNSTRLGWNWKSDTLMLYSYAYLSKARKSKKIANFARKKPIYVEQWYQGKDTVWISCVQGKMAKAVFVTGTGISPTSGYILYPYFGGTSVASQSMNIKVWGVKYY